MTEAISLPGDTQIAVGNATHARLRGLLSLPAEPLALVVLMHAGPAPEARDDALSVLLQHAGIGTLTLDLLSHTEQRFEDNHHSVPLLARRLLDGLTLIKQRMSRGEMPTLPIGFCAAGDCSPVALRVAALRDEDIFAIVCRDGLIDRAGVVYLRSLASPLLVLVAQDDARVEASNRRALDEVTCRKDLRLLPADGDSPDSAARFAFIARETVQWFVGHLSTRSAAQRRV